MPIHYETAVDHTVVITIDRPEAKNALDLYHFRDLAAAWRRFAEDDDAWTAIVTGVGRNFMSGADLKTYIPQITKLHDEIQSGGVDEIDGCKLRDGTDAVLRGTKIYKPIIAAVNGPCVAGGMEMLGGIDIRVATTNARFGVMEPKRGLFAGGGTTVRLPRQLAFPAAMEFLLTAEAFPAERVVPAPTFASPPFPPNGPSSSVCSTRSSRRTSCWTRPGPGRPGSTPTVRWPSGRRRRASCGAWPRT